MFPDSCVALSSNKKGYCAIYSAVPPRDYFASSLILRFRNHYQAALFFAFAVTYQAALFFAFVITYQATLFFAFEVNGTHRLLGAFPLVWAEQKPQKTDEQNDAYNGKHVKAYQPHSQTNKLVDPQ